jgi:septum formation protein
VAFEAVPARIDEAAVTDALRGRPVRDVADRLAELKAVKVSQSRPGVFVLGSDSMLEVDKGRWLEKPGDVEGLKAQLRELRGRSHRLVSAAVVARDGVPIWRHVEAATLSVRAFSEDWLDLYAATAVPAVLSSVGGYHLEGIGAQLFTKVEGDQFVVRGLPLLAVLGWLREAGAMPA